MARGIPYYPSLSKEHIRAFERRLAQCPGSWTLAHSFYHIEDPRVLCLRWIVAGARWCDIPGYLDFLDHRPYRLLLRCFFRQSSQRWRTLASLCQYLDCTPAEIEAALSFCEFQEFLMRGTTFWYPGPVMERIENIGSTFEWAVQEGLQRFCGAIARRCVVLQEFQNAQLGDLDILAFIEGLVVMVECKSGTTIPRNDLIHFLQRATLFPADIALLLIDTAEEEPLTCRLALITSLLGLSLEHPECCTQEGSLIYRIADTIYVANTAAGIQATLQAVLAIGQRRTHQPVHPSGSISQQNAALAESNQGEEKHG